jgi:hypothetical protein
MHARRVAASVWAKLAIGTVARQAAPKARSIVFIATPLRP